MKTLEISKKCSIESIINSINKDFIKENKKHSVIAFESNISRSERENIVNSIKDFFDIFIILKTNIPQSANKIEEFFSYGVHGIYFSDDLIENAEEQLNKIADAIQIFPEGLIFAKAGSNSKLVEKMLERRIIPVVSLCNQELIDFIRNHRDFSMICSKYLKYIPVLEENICNFTLIENIKLKMQLESLNLKKKLRVKNVADSFNSSGL